MAQANLGPDGEILVNMEFARTLVETAIRDKDTGKYDYYVKAGSELAETFRRSFPNISDHDLGLIMIAMAQQLMAVMDAGLMSTLEAKSMSFAYLFAAAEVLRTVVDLDGM